MRRLRILLLAVVLGSCVPAVLAGSDPPPPGTNANGIDWNTDQPDPSGSGTITGTGWINLGSSPQYSNSGVTSYVFSSTGNFFTTSPVPVAMLCCGYQGSWTLSLSDIPQDDYIVYCVMGATDLCSNTIMYNTSQGKVTVKDVPAAAPGGKIDATGTVGGVNKITVKGTITPAVNWDIQGKVTAYFFGAKPAAPGLSPRAILPPPFSAGTKQKDGTYQFQVDTSGIPPGMYVVYLTVGFTTPGAQQVKYGNSTPVTVTVTAN